MSLSAVLVSAPRIPQESQESQMVDPRLLTHAGDDESCCSIVSKVAAVALITFVTIATFVIGGPLIGIVAIVLAGASLHWLFDCCNDDDRGMIYYPHIPVGGGHMMHSHHGAPQYPSDIRGGRNMGVGTRTTDPHDHGSGPYVPGHTTVRGGHIDPRGHEDRGPYVPGHITVGGGHPDPRAPARGMPVSSRTYVPDPRVPGRGPGPHGFAPPGHDSPEDHVGVGRGHTGR